MIPTLIQKLYVIQMLTGQDFLPTKDPLPDIVSRLVVI